MTVADLRLTLQPDVQDFMHWLEQAHDDDWLEPVPGLIGSWLASELRLGLKLGALKVRRAGFCYAAVNHTGNGTDRKTGLSYSCSCPWCKWERQMAFERRGKVTPERAAEIKGRMVGLLRTFGALKPTATTLRDGDRVVATPESDPWRFDA